MYVCTILHTSPSLLHTTPTILHTTPTILHTTHSRTYLEFLVQFAAVAIQSSQVQRPKICIETAAQECILKELCYTEWSYT